MMPYTVKPLNRSAPTLRIDKIQVLVVVGGEKAASLIKSIFEQLGFRNLMVAYDPDEAVAMMREVIIDLVVTDAEIRAAALHSDTEDGEAPPPEYISGVELVRHLRTSPSSPNPYIPVIMLVNQATAKSIIDARDSGVNEIVLKPINAADFCLRLIHVVDHPRPFVTADTYKGPCRRRKQVALPEGQAERRLREVRLFRHTHRWQNGTL